MRLTDVAVAGEPIKQSIMVQRLEINFSEETKEFLLKLFQAEPKTGEWIPCSERLPSEYAQYLVCFESGECYVYWLEDSDLARGIAEKEGIIAWMPLPKPYKKSEVEP